METKRIKATDIENIDKILSQDGLTARCSKVQFKKLFYDTSTNEGEYRCVVKSDDEVIAEIEFTMKINDDGIKYAYIDRVDNDYPVQINRKKSGKQKEIYVVGSHVIFKAVRKAKKLGAKYILLLPLDTGSGKLFKYYKSLGFKCAPDEINPTDFPDMLEELKDPTIFEWYENCSFMLGYTDDILKHCCKAIDYK